MAETNGFHCPRCGVTWAGGRYCDNCSWDLFTSETPGQPSTPESKPSPATVVPRQTLTPRAPSSPPWTPTTTPYSAQSEAQEARAGTRWAGIVVLIGAALIVLGAFLPWSSVQSGFEWLGFTGPVSGIDFGSDGIFTCAIGVGMGVAGIAMLVRSGRQTLGQAGTLFGAVVTGMVVSKNVAAIRNGYELPNRVLVDSIGIGLYVVSAGAVVAGAGALLYGMKRRSGRSR